MNLWPYQEWELAVEHDGQTSRLQPRLPFAFIGSHPLCAVRIEDPSVPSFAYLACAFDDGVELSPLLTDAGSRGRTMGESVSLAGRTIRVNSRQDASPIHQADASSILEPRGGSVVVRFGLGERVIRRRLGHRLVILGDDRPSAIRVRGLGLARCDHAIIDAGDRIALISLRPTSGASLAQLARSVSFGSPIMVGAIVVSFDRVPLVSRRLGGAVPAMGCLDASRAGGFVGWEKRRTVVLVGPVSQIGVDASQSVSAYATGPHEQGRAEACVVSSSSGGFPVVATGFGVFDASDDLDQASPAVLPASTRLGGAGSGAAETTT